MVSLHGLSRCFEHWTCPRTCTVQVRTTRSQAMFHSNHIPANVLQKIRVRTPSHSKEDQILNPRPGV